MIKYRADYNGNISTVEVTKETEKMIVLASGNRCAKTTEWRSFYDTWGEAHKHLLEKAQMMVDARRRSLEQAKGKLGQIKGMKEPT